jgi:two-component system chemotaxis sensor kinase CheA
MDEIVQEFLVESHENLDQLDHDLVELEQDPTSRALLSSIFRTIHTIKGTSGFLAFSQLEGVTHVGESLLSRLRDGALQLTPEMTSALLAMVDAVRALLGEIEESGQEGDRDHSALIARLTALQEPATSSAAPTAAAAPAPTPTAEPVESTPDDGESPVADPASASTDEQTPLLGEVLVTQGAVTEDEVILALAAQEVGDDRRIGEILVNVGDTTPEAVAAALDTQHEGRRSAADSTIRVDVDLLDTLMNLVGELVLTRNQIVQRAATRQDPDLLRTSHRLNLIAGELQEGVMRTRMQAIDTVWSKLPRVVRDLSVQLGKQVRVQMEDRDTELDKTILESVKDPLTHLVRNSVDHGIETPEARTAAGKPVEGTLTLRAFHEGGQVNIEICDDGAGIDPEKLRARAVARGLMTPEAVARLTDRESFNLIFTAGFSTAETVTNVSGRGVGMDVVKTNIEKIGGLVDVHSVLGEGTTIRIKIPLTLAIIPALVVSAEGRRYAIPQVNLLELLRLDAAGDGPKVELIHGTPVYRLRGQLLPLVSLRRQLGLDESTADATYIAVLQADDRQFGLVVDDIRDTEEIVVKPLGSLLRHIDVYAGATIMGDGEVALILDTMALAQHAGVVSEGSSRTETGETEHASSGERAHLLVAGLSDGRQVALPLDAVDRLEEIAQNRVERIGSQEVVQYRGRVLPLVRLDHVYGAYGAEDATGGPLQVVVCGHGGALVGFVVRSILDIVDAELSVRSSLDSGGRLGSAVISGNVTELVDVAHAVGSLGDLLRAQAAAVAADPSSARSSQPAPSQPSPPVAV